MNTASDTPLFDVLILGAGASGLACALSASSKGLKVAVADKASVPGRKVRLAGGGMGNITNKSVSPEWYVGEDTKFAASCLRKFPFRAAIAFAEDFNFPLEERKNGEIFGLRPVSHYVEAVTERCIEQKTTFFMNHTAIASEKRNEVFFTTFKEGKIIRSKALVLALGSPAFPSSGSSATGATLAKHFGHTCLPFRPVLTPLVLPNNHPLQGLQGISTDVGIRAGNLTLIRSLLFTHKGISGPAGLVASCFWHSGQSLEMDFLPQKAETKDLLFEGDNERRTASGVLKRFFPQRLADALLVMAQRQSKEPLKLDRPLAEWSKKARLTLSATVHRCDLTPDRTEGLRTAEAASGGVLTKDLNPRTMESRIVPRLYIIGELVDITGLLGGFNLHWAFASGKTAGDALLT